MVLRDEKEIINSWSGDISKPKISFCCISYNHEDYIEDTLKGFLMQETSVPFEIVIDDDASTDDTAKIILEYQKRYPNIVKANIRDKNVGFYKNYLDNIERANGEYVALCEGDDYWIDSKKIEKQYQMMEKNLNCSFCGHDVNIVDMKGNFIIKHSKGRINENWDDRVVDSRVVLNSTWSIPQTSALFFRKKFFNRDYFENIYSPLGADYAFFVYLCSKGDFAYIADTMSCYRQNPTSISSNWSYSNNDDLMRKSIESHKSIDRYFNHKYTKEIDRHLSGIYFTKYKEEFQKGVISKNYLKALINIFYMLYYSRNHDYSLRDVLWIIKEEFKQKRGWL